MNFKTMNSNKEVKEIIGMVLLMFAIPSYVIFLLWLIKSFIEWECLFELRDMRAFIVVTVVFVLGLFLTKKNE